MRYFKKLLLLAALIVPWATQAQTQTLSNYAFTTGLDSSKWVNMASATQILTCTGNDGAASAVVNIGFSFPFADTAYTQYSVNTDGNLRLGGTVTGTTNYTTPFGSSTANQNNPKINAFGCDGYGTASHYVKALKQELSSGDTMLVVEQALAISFINGRYISIPTATSTSSSPEPRAYLPLLPPLHTNADSASAAPTDGSSSPPPTPPPISLRDRPSPMAPTPGLTLTATIASSIPATSPARLRQQLQPKPPRIR